MLPTDAEEDSVGVVEVAVAAVNLLWDLAEKAMETRERKAAKEVADAVVVAATVAIVQDTCDEEVPVVAMKTKAVTKILARTAMKASATVDLAVVDEVAVVLEAVEVAEAIEAHTADAEASEEVSEVAVDSAAVLLGAVVVVAVALGLVAPRLGRAVPKYHHDDGLVNKNPLCPSHLLVFSSFFAKC